MQEWVLESRATCIWILWKIIKRKYLSKDSFIHGRVKKYSKADKRSSDWDLPEEGYRRRLPRIPRLSQKKHKTEISDNHLTERQRVV